MFDQSISRRALVGRGAAATLGLTWLGRAAAQAALPKGPITLIVPFAAGGATDVVSRLIGQKLSERLSHTVIIENMGGGGGSIGAARVAKAPADGSMLLMGTVATHAINPLTMSKLSYDPVRDFTPISLVAKVPNVLLVSNSLKVQNVKELIALLKAEPGKYSYGSSGVGTPPHLSGELFKSMVGVDMAHIPYKGGGPAMADLVGGQIPIMFDVLTGAVSHIRAGSVRALAVTTDKRSPSLPNVPTMAEAGVPGYETYTWNALFGPAGLPRAYVEQVSREAQRVVAEPEVQAKLKDLTAIPVGSPPDVLLALVRSELEKWKPVIDQMGGLKQ